MNGCEGKRNVKQIHLQPPDDQSKTGTLATHSGKRSLTEFCRFKAVNFYFLTNPRKNASF